MTLIPRDDETLITRATATRAEAFAVEHRGIRFDVELIGLDTWRWTIHTDTPQGFRLIGQFRGQREAAIDHCHDTIDAHLDQLDQLGVA